MQNIKKDIREKVALKRAQAMFNITYGWEITAMSQP